MVFKNFLFLKKIYIISIILIKLYFHFLHSYLKHFILEIFEPTVGEREEKFSPNIEGKMIEEKMIASGRKYREKYWQNFLIEESKE